jgi:hypothetical protein
MAAQMTQSHSPKPMRVVVDTVHQMQLIDLCIRLSKAINLLIVLKRLLFMRCLLEPHRFLFLVSGINIEAAIFRIRSLILLLAWKLHNNPPILSESLTRLNTPTLLQSHTLSDCFVKTLPETLPASAATNHSCNATSASES